MAKKMAFKIKNYWMVLSGCLAVTGLLVSCQEQSNASADFYQIQGKAQGTTYMICYRDSLGRNFSVAIDSLLKDFDLHLSTYKDESVVSKINVADSCSPSSNLFNNCLNQSEKLYFLTGGLFNPAINPLVAYWKNIAAEQGIPDSLKIDSIVRSIRLENKLFAYDEKIFCKFLPVQFDFNAVAQGYSVDVVYDFLLTLGLTDFMVEIGGEVRTAGLNENQQEWNIGIDKPLENSISGENLQAIIGLSNKALATSGNYRKFVELKGKKVGHTINPVTGYPADNNLLSATVICNDCATADAMATTFMVMGVEKTKSFIQNHPELQLDVYLIYGEIDAVKTWSSDGVLLRN